MQSDLDARDARDSLFCKVSQLQDHVLRLLADRIVLSLLGSGGEGEGARRAGERKMGRSAGGLGGGRRPLSLPSAMSMCHRYAASVTVEVTVKPEPILSCLLHVQR